LHACSLTGSQVDECLYIGDAQRDIEAGKNARMTTLVALFGYLGEEDRPDEWQADGMLNQPGDLLEWLVARP
jgi:phosphoglycolate phosphatase